MALYRCTVLSEPLLVNSVIRSKISCAGSYMVLCLATELRTKNMEDFYLMESFDIVLSYLTKLKINKKKYL